MRNIKKVYKTNNRNYFDYKQQCVWIILQKQTYVWGSVDGKYYFMFLFTMNLSTNVFERDPVSAKNSDIIHWIV